jgi:hypothetical protein
MSSRKEEKERLRQERVAREQAEAAAAARRRKLIYGAGALAAVVVIAVVVILVASGGGGDDKSSSASTGSDSSSQSAEGLQTTPAPWQPETQHLADRFEASGLPQSGSESYHIHSMLRIYINGKQEPVPANIGIDPSGAFLAALHTHKTDGIIHMEADAPYPFKLGQFFDIWGVKFTNTQVGAYYNQGKNTVQVYVNGKKVANPVGYVMKPHDAIAVGYGAPGSFPAKFDAKFPPGF